MKRNIVEAVSQFLEAVGLDEEPMPKRVIDMSSAEVL